MKYLVWREQKEGITSYDCLLGAFDTIEEANQKASREWDYLTKKEQNKCKLQVLIVTKEDLNADAIDEDGCIDWGGFHSASTNEYCFDSENLLKEID